MCVKLLIGNSLIFVGPMPATVRILNAALFNGPRD